MLVELQEVNKFYNRGQISEVHALKNIDLEIAAGQAVCLMGPSGSGKSTLLGIIGCMAGQTSGKVSIAGKRLSRMPEHVLTRYRRENIGFIFQRFHLIEDLSAADNISLPLIPLGVSPKKRVERSRILLDKLGIGHRASFRVSSISGGEMQRVAIGRALINNPPLILADEPTAHLDRVLSLSFMEVMAGLKKEGKTLVFTSHDPLVCEHDIIDKVIYLDDGQIVDKQQD